MCRLPDGCMPEKTRALMVGGFEGVIFILSDFEITVEKLVYGGEGLGRLEGRAVLAPFVLPGERARVRGVSEKPGLVRAGLLEVLAAAPERVAPPCPYFMRCGGCHYQHAPYEMQLALKRGILEDQLRRIGKIAPSAEICVLAGGPWGYRNRVRLHLRLSRGATGRLPLSACAVRDAACAQARHPGRPVAAHREDRAVGGDLRAGGRTLGLSQSRAIAYRERRARIQGSAIAQALPDRALPDRIARD